MLTIKQEYSLNEDLQIYFPHTPLDQILFFDIETTGLSPEYSMIYLIGYLEVYHNNVMLTQFLAESVEDEKTILEDFIQVLENKALYVNFNGNAFDIPFINQRLKKNNMKLHQIDKANSFDLLQEIKLKKKELNLINYKLKTIENYLGIYRQDLFTGGELIQQFLEYTNTKDKVLEKNLLLHNAEDIYHMTKILKILKFESSQFDFDSFCRNVQFEQYNNAELLRLEVCLPTIEKDNFNVSKDNYSMRWDSSRNIFRLTARISTLELMYFYPDYKNYYYIPSQDQALHKSVAKYLDLSDKQLAKASNCYSKANGIFIESMLSSFCFPLCKKSYKDSTYYIPLEFNNNAPTLKIEFAARLVYEILKP